MGVDSIFPVLGEWLLFGDWVDEFAAAENVRIPSVM